MQMLKVRRTNDANVESQTNDVNVESRTDG